MAYDLGYKEFLDNYELAVTFVYNGNPYRGAVGDITAGLGLGDGGFASSSDLTIVAGAAQFGTTLPNKKGTIALNGKTYRVDSTALSPDNAMVVINLQDATKGV